MNLFIKKINKIVLATLVIVIGSLSINANAQEKIAEKAIQFAKGENSSSVSGTALRGESHRYVLWAKHGQEMSVQVSSKEQNAVFQITSPSKDEFLPGAGEEDDAQSWKGVLPRSGKYVIVVGGSRGNATYKLSVAITQKK